MLYKLPLACRSERVSKTGVNGVLLTEAKYINLSLHYLEQVKFAPLFTYVVKEEQEGYAETLIVDKWIES